jgi:hypothetical protein
VPHQTLDIPIGSLLLDLRNPRYPPARSQRDAFRSLIASERQKLVALAHDIVTFGLSPIDLLLVVSRGRNYIVLEGNRRLSAIRMLNNPDLAADTPIEAAMRRLALDADSIDEAPCTIVPSREEARHWIELRHSGEGDGAGVVRWNAIARNRFSHRPGTQVAQALEFLEAVTRAYPGNDVIADLAARIAETRITTLGRLVRDPNFRARAGITEQTGTLLFSFTPEALLPFFEHVLGDLATDLSVSQIKSKDLRSRYLSSTPEPEASGRLADPRPLSNGNSSNGATASRPNPRPSRPPRPLRGLKLRNLGAKTQAVLQEFQRLDVDKLPNAAAVLIRAILELSLDEYIRAKGLPYDNRFSKRVKKCLTNIDPRGTDPRFQFVRAGLQDGTSLYAVATLHGYVHSQFLHADGMTVRQLCSNLEPFLEALNDAA